MYIIVVCHMDDTGLMDEVVLINEAGFLFLWTRVIFLLIRFQFGGWFGFVGLELLCGFFFFFFFFFFFLQKSSC